MASSSSSLSLPVLSSPSWNYDVFLSFRGEDTRKTFVDHLYKALDQEGIYTYKDDVTLPRGESISLAFLKAIEESQIAVIIFSKNYANSSWCLDEVTHIMKRREEGKQTVFPIFYDVEPSDVRKQKRTYKEAFDKHEPKNTKKIKSWGQVVLNGVRGWFSTPQEQPQLENKVNVDTWRNALVEASNISGWETKQIANGHEAQGIKQIVDEISQRLVTSRANEDLVGMRTRMQRLKSNLQIEARGVRMIGVWGVGGGGKTTLANSIYDDISSMFDSCCFVNNIREESSSKNGLEKLQEILISGILKKKVDEVEVRRVEEGRRMIKARSNHKKVLIVLDDVDHLDQLKALVGSHDWFGERSRIIITTRDQHILNVHGVDVIHPINLLKNDEAVKLFRNHANRDYKPKEDFEALTQEVVRYAGGLPLALRVLGCFLCDKDIGEWASALARLKMIPEDDILLKLKISFDGLKQVEKDLFLDIACFFRGKYKYEKMELLSACGLHPVIGVKVLRQKALIVINEYGQFDMHDLVQEMAHYIVREEHHENPRRVWEVEDVRKILDKNATTKLDNIEAIDQRSLSYEDTQRFLQVVGNMNKLQWIDLNWDPRQKNGQRDENIVPLPANFPPPQLCYLFVKDCIRQKQLWEGYKDLRNLTYMKLHDMPNLIKIPDFSGLPNLQTFELRDCPCLKEIVPSIGQLENLNFTSIIDCPSLTMFPSITRFKKLETLTLSGYQKPVNITQFQELQQHEMDNLPHLPFDHSSVASCSNSWSSSPCSISPPGVDSCLSYYNLTLRRLQFSHTTLRKLNLSKFISRDEEIAIYVGELPNLEELNLFGNKLVSPLDFSKQLPRLKYLEVSHCFTTSLTPLYDKCLIIHLPSSIAVVYADGCKSLESFGGYSNCKWLWKVSIRKGIRLDQCGVNTLINSILQGNASKDHFMNVALDNISFQTSLWMGSFWERYVNIIFRIIGTKTLADS